MSGEDIPENKGGMERRSFLKITLLAGGALALAGLGAWEWKGRAPLKPNIRLAGPSPERGHRIRENHPFPDPETWEKTRVLIIGGGIAGLSAARALPLPKEEWILIDLEPQYGGNSSHGKNAISPFPWGAHYLPVPDAADQPLLDFLFEIGVIEGFDAENRPRFREDYLCHSPHERLLIHGVWQDGLVPKIGLSAQESEAFTTFFAKMDLLQKEIGADGRPVFAIPVDQSSQDPQWLDLDKISFSDWLNQNQFTEKPLLWYAEYCCKDDFGTDLETTSAWAGLHYFASRKGSGANAPEGSILTWPEGNGWLMEQLAGPNSSRIRTHQMATRIFPKQEGVANVKVSIFDFSQNKSIGIEAEAVIFCGPRFVAEKILPELPSLHESFTYAPWLVANISLKEKPAGQGARLSWDNVGYNRPSLGYIVATHQSLSSISKGPTVLTWYEALSEKTPQEGRKWLETTPMEQLKDHCLQDLEFLHPGIGEKVDSVELWRWGHGMIRPVPGFLWGEARKQAQKPFQGVFFAHSDLSGMSLFEEAFFQGRRAAAEVVTALSLRKVEENHEG